MRISEEGKIGIGLALFFGVGSGATVIWPDQKMIGWAIMAFSIFGLAGLILNHFFTIQRREKKEFTYKTVAQMFEVYEGHTTLRGDMIFSQYFGLWMTVTGVPKMMRKHKKFIHISLVSDPIKGNADVHLALSEKYEKALKRLEVNEPITVTGQIKDGSNGLWVRLGNCELVSTNLPISPPVIQEPQLPLIETSPQKSPD